MRALAALAFLLCAGLWAWAIWYPKEAVPLPERFVGEYRLYDFKAPPDVSMPNPIPPGQTWNYTLRRDGSYLIIVTLARGHELSRREGLVSVDGEGVLTLTQVSQDRTHRPRPPDAFRPRWVERPEPEPEAPPPPERVPVLVLRNVAAGYELSLVRQDRWEDLREALAAARRAKAKPSSGR